MLNTKNPQSNGTRTLLVNVMLKERYVFTLRYRYFPLFRLDLEDVAKEVIKKRPSLKEKPFQMWLEN